MRLYAAAALALALATPLGQGCAPALGTGAAVRAPATSDHFDGAHYFNPGEEPSALAAAGSTPGTPRRSWVWRWLWGGDWPAWPDAVDAAPGPPPPERVGAGRLRVTLVNHATFLIQMDGVNVLTDPIWSDRCSPVSWFGPRRHRPPGLRFEDLPHVDAVLVSHNHYDHLDRPSLGRLAERFRPRAFTPLGNGGLLSGAGLAAVEELDWWQSVPLGGGVTLTLVPARHFSARTLWDRNEALWGGFVLSGPSGNVYFAGDTGYGPHFREIGRRFAPVALALLPISPFRPREAAPPETAHAWARVHLGPAEAVQAHLDLGAARSLAAHFQTFQLGEEGFADAPEALAAAAAARGLAPGAFAAPEFGQGTDGPGGGEGKLADQAPAGLPGATQGAL